MAVGPNAKGQTTSAVPDRQVALPNWPPMPLVQVLEEGRQERVTRRHQQLGTELAIVVQSGLRHRWLHPQKGPLMPPGLRPLDLVCALGTGGLLTLMVLFNGALADFTTPFFSSLAAHGTGTVAAAFALIFLGRGSAQQGLGRAPLWAYLGGLSGAVTVMLTSVTVNSVLALSGTLALGLAGQVVFGLAADRFGLFGLPRRKPTAQDIGALVLIVGGALLIIFSGALA